MKKLKNQRFFLCKDADSYAKLSIPSKYDREYSLKLADCNRSITMYFAISSDKAKEASIKKLEKLKKLIDSLHAELTR